MNQRLLNVAVFRRSMESVGAALEHGREQTASRVTKFGGHTRGEEFHLLQRVDGGGGDLVGGTDHRADGFFSADSIHGVSDSALALPNNVLPVDIGGGRQVQQKAKCVFLED